MVLAEVSLFLVRIFQGQATVATHRSTVQFLLPHKFLVQLMMEELEVLRFKKLQLDAKISTVRALQLAVQTLALKFLILLHLLVGVQMELTRELKQFN
jgi:hypothetical protein